MLVPGSKNWTGIGYDFKIQFQNQNKNQIVLRTRCGTKFWCSGTGLAEPCTECHLALPGLTHSMVEWVLEEISTSIIVSLICNWACLLIVIVHVGPQAVDDAAWTWVGTMVTIYVLSNDIVGTEHIISLAGIVVVKIIFSSNFRVHILFPPPPKSHEILILINSSFCHHQLTKKKASSAN